MEIGFFLKKLITFFVEPFGMVFTLLLIGMYFLFTEYGKTKRNAKRFLGLGFFLLFLFSYTPFSNMLVENLEDKYHKYDYKEKITYIHVLGSGHNDDFTQPLSSMIGSDGMKRVLEGIIIHKKTPNSKLIFTGYAGDASETTAQMNANLALALGVKKEDMIVNGEPKDTAEEAKFTKSLVGDSPFVLVTSATHMPRSMALFTSLNLHPIAAPTAFRKQKIHSYFPHPNAKNIVSSQVAMHEYIGMLWNKLKN
jgi:uncharacterized SAM-binding protein YcdF (DUF218 family)